MGETPVDLITKAISAEDESLTRLEEHRFDALRSLF